MPELIKVEQQFMRVSEVAKVLGLAVNTILSHIHSGKLDAIQVSTGHRPAYRISIESLERFIERQAVGEVPTPRKRSQASGKWFRKGEKVAKVLLLALTLSAVGCGEGWEKVCHKAKAEQEAENQAAINKATYAWYDANTIANQRALEDEEYYSDAFNERTHMLVTLRDIDPSELTEEQQLVRQWLIEEEERRLELRAMNNARIDVEFFQRKMLEQTRQNEVTK